jgi:hypothetical protein
MRHTSLIAAVLLISLTLCLDAEELVLFPTESTTIVGTTDSGEIEARLLLDFDFGSIPRNAQVIDASLYFEGVDVSNVNGWICLYVAPMLTEWDAENASWDGPSPGEDWESPGGDWSYALGDYGCLYGDSEGSEDLCYTPSLNLTTLLVDQLAAPERQKGFIVFPTEIEIQDMNEAEIEIGAIRQLRCRLVVEYETEPAPGGFGKPGVRRAEAE